MSIFFKKILTKFAIISIITKPIYTLLIWIIAIIFIILSKLYGEEYFNIIVKCYILLIIIISPITYNLYFKDEKHSINYFLFCITLLCLILILIFM